MSFLKHYITRAKIQLNLFYSRREIKTDALTVIQLIIQYPQMYPVYVTIYFYYSNCTGVIINCSVYNSFRRIAQHQLVYRKRKIINPNTSILIKF